MTILDSILGVFTSVGEWISESITALMPVFYGESGLTFIGVLAVASLAFSVVFLIRKRKQESQVYTNRTIYNKCVSVPKLGILASSSSVSFRTSSTSEAKKFAYYPPSAKGLGAFRAPSPVGGILLFGLTVFTVVSHNQSNEFTLISTRARKTRASPLRKLFFYVSEMNFCPRKIHSKKVIFR